MSSIKLITSELIDEFTQHIADADAIYLLISFVMESGVKMLAPYLRNAAKEGTEIKLLTGDYLYVTQPEALNLLFDVHPDMEIRLWKSNGISFHPKAYLFHKISNQNAMIVGSSNLSKSAWTSGVEWNLSVSTTDHDDAFVAAESQFLRMFYADQTVPVNVETISRYELEYHEYHRQHPNLARTWTDVEALETMFEIIVPFGESMVEEATRSYHTTIQPRPAQLEALQQLQNTKEEEYDKALVIMATGLGKTFLAALFAKDYDRILFIAHREEILEQARRAFHAVSPEKTSGFFTGKQKDVGVELLFASVMTLGQKRHRTRFDRQHFDLVIVDEFHHAAATSYRSVIEWFQPKFLLGITATPDRTDNRDVYSICDGNVAYRIDFLEAIERKWLAPFHYIGVYDETDYSQVRWLGTKYDEQELLAVQTRDSMAYQVLNAWQQYARTRGLGFCSSVAQTEFLANFFRNQGIKAISLHSGSSPAVRSGAVRQLEGGELDIIFTVDLFNEGVDIPSVDTLLFVRPTESLTIFTQQIGRGLRLHPGKTHCNIIDLIGNYRNADLKLSLFHITDSIEKLSPTQQMTSLPLAFPGCHIELDVHVINLLNVMRKKRQPRKERLKDAYFSLKQELGRRPTYLEMHLLSSIESREIKQEYRSYPAFLDAVEEWNADEQSFFQQYEVWFREVESTVMSKGYKMVMLLAMLEKGVEEWYKPVTAAEIAPFFYQYYMEKSHRRNIDWNDRKTRDLLQYDEAKIADLIEEMPMTKWAGSSNGLARFDGMRFWVALDVHKKEAKFLYDCTREICLYRLHVYFEKKAH